MQRILVWALGPLGVQWTDKVINISNICIRINCENRAAHSVFLDKYICIMYSKRPFESKNFTQNFSRELDHRRTVSYLTSIVLRSGPYAVRYAYTRSFPRFWHKSCDSLRTPHWFWQPIVEVLCENMVDSFL